MDANPRVVGASAGALKCNRTRFGSLASTWRNSGVWHSGTGSMARSSNSGRQGREVVGEFQQQRQLVLALYFGEVGHHLG